MANSLTAFNEEFWAAEMQIILFKENVAIALANTEYRAQLARGDTLNKPYRSKPYAVDYTKGTDITVKDRSGTNDYLSVATAKVVPFYVDDIDKIQNKWDMAQKYAQDAQKLLNNILDQVIAGEYSHANSYIDAGDVGGSSGSGISLAVSTISQVFTAASRKLDLLNVPQAGRFALIGPRILEILRLYLAGKDTNFADIVGRNGKVMERFGFEIFYSNNLAYAASLAMATNPTADDTVTIAGVAFKFVATPTAAGDVDIGGDAATSVANLVAAINDTGTVGTTYIQLSDNNRWKLNNAGVVATNNTTSISIVAYGDIAVSETLTATADVWSSQLQHGLFGLKKATDLVLQKSPTVEFRLAEKRLGRYVYPWMLYGYKTFDDMKDCLVDVRVNASSW